LAFRIGHIVLIWQPWIAAHPRISSWACRAFAMCHMGEVCGALRKPNTMHALQPRTYAAAGSDARVISAMRAAAGSDMCRVSHLAQSGLMCSCHNAVGDSALDGWQDLKPGLVYTRISGYGQTGPKASLPGYASVCEAYGGLRCSPIGYIWSYLVCRVGHLVPILQPCIGSSPARPARRCQQSLSFAT
jgi:CoA-transferase family III